MKKLLGAVLLTSLIMMLVALAGGSASIADGDAAEGDAGQEAFMTLKCNTCHGVPGLGIEAKSKSKALQGPDLPFASTADRATVIKYIRKETDIEGRKSHKKPVKATDEELNTVLDWLATQAAPETE